MPTAFPLSTAFRLNSARAVLLASSLACAATAVAAPLPPGPYRSSCSNSSLSGSTLISSCADFFGKHHTTKLTNALLCKNIQNINGSLRCVLFEQNTTGDHATLFDIVSVSREFVTNGAHTKVWRIDNPRVWERKTEYPEITFKPGDRITITSAGGCAQTGGSGKTWKRYVNPLGPDASNYYSGTVWIDGVTGEFDRIGGLIDQTFTVPAFQNPELNKELDLNLGYQDSNFSDNGYWNHDNGNPAQCVNVGPAFVEITVVTPAPGTVTSNGPVFSPHSLPFDLVWDINNEDFNGLPKDALWAFQLTHPDQRPDFMKTCGAAFTGDDTIHLDILSRTCTSQDVYTGLYHAAVPCHAGILPGHLDWTIATYEGPVTWEGWSGIWPFDNDYNLRLQPRHANALTSESTTLGLEYNGSEVMDNTTTPFWRQLKSSAIDVLHTSSDTAKLFNGASGLFGVVIGLVGLDCAHAPPATEIHPVYALALRTEQTPTANNIQQKWVFFLRNSGNEGECADGLHFWDSPNREYSIQLPWPQGATSMSFVGDQSEFFAWDDAAITGDIQQFQHAFSVLKFKFPNDGEFGVDGQVTFNFTVPADHKAPARKNPVQVTSQSPAEDFDKDKDEGLGALGNTIADPAAKANFKSDLAALGPLSMKPPKNRIPLSITPTLTEYTHVPGAASRGQLTKSRTVPDPVKQKLTVETQRILKTYGTQPPTPTVKQ